MMSISSMTPPDMGRSLLPRAGYLAIIALHWLLALLFIANFSLVLTVVGRAKGTTADVVFATDIDRFALMAVAFGVLAIVFVFAWMIRAELNRRPRSAALSDVHTAYLHELGLDRRGLALRRALSRSALSPFIAGTTIYLPSLIASVIGKLKGARDDTIDFALLHESFHFESGESRYGGMLDALLLVNAFTAALALAFGFPDIFDSLPVTIGSALVFTLVHLYPLRSIHHVGEYEADRFAVDRLKASGRTPNLGVVMGWAAGTMHSIATRSSPSPEKRRHSAENPAVPFAFFVTIAMVLYIWVLNTHLRFDTLARGDGASLYAAFSAALDIVVAVVLVGFALATRPAFITRPPNPAGLLLLLLPVAGSWFVNARVLERIFGFEYGYNVVVSAVVLLMLALWTIRGRKDPSAPGVQPNV